MTDTNEAPTSGGGLGPFEHETVLDGVAKMVSRKEEYDNEVEADRLVQRMAAMTVRRKTNRHGCKEASTGSCTNPGHARDVQELQEIVQMLELSGTIDPPTDEERAVLTEHLPQVLVMDTRKPGDMVVPGRK